MSKISAQRANSPSPDPRSAPVTKEPSSKTVQFARTPAAATRSQAVTGTWKKAVQHSAAHTVSERVQSKVTNHIKQPFNFSSEGLAFEPTNLNADIDSFDKNSSTVSTRPEIGKRGIVFQETNLDFDIDSLTNK